jgi:CBS domain-containing protein
VVDSDGKLLGVVNRRDLLNVFLVPDEDISRQAGELLADVIPESPVPVETKVRGGVVMLTGELDGAARHARVAEAIDLA